MRLYVLRLVVLINHLICARAAATYLVFARFTALCRHCAYSQCATFLLKVDKKVLKQFKQPKHEAQLKTINSRVDPLKHI